MTTGAGDTVEGVLLVDKPAGPTSHDIVDRLRRALGQPRAGHAGTLDPFATGLLVLCLGRATRLARFLGGGAKLYEGVIRLGLATDTDDVTGRPLAGFVPELPGGTPDEDALRRAAASLTGQQSQMPPIFSARKVGGVPAHRRARRGQQVALQPTPVIVHSFELGPAENGRVPFRCLVSPGTYVRALARDLGQRLDTGACLESLRRLASGPYRIEEAVPPDLAPELLRCRVQGLDQLPLGLGEIILTEESARRFADGQMVSSSGPPGFAEGAAVRVIGPQGLLLGIGRVREGIEGPRSVQPEVVFGRREG